MAVPRASAIVTEDVALRAFFVNVQGEFFDPFEISQVRILDTDAVTLLLLIDDEDDIVKISTGQWEVVVPEGTYPIGGVYYDEWTFKEKIGDANQVKTASTTVLESGPKIRSRSDAVVETDVYLLAEFRNDVTGALFDPDGDIQKVELLDTDGVTVMQTVVAPNIVKLETGIYRVIMDGSTHFDVAGTYKDKWSFTHEDVADTQTADIVVGIAPTATLRSVRMQVLDTSLNPSMGVKDVTVVVYDAITGSAVKELTTDAYGYATFSLADGSYIVSWKKGSLTFTKNNLAFTITSDAAYTLEGASKTPPYDASALIADADKVTASIKVANIDGTPVKGRSVRLSNLHSPLMKGDVGVLGGGLTVKTDGAGKASISLIKGAKIGVSVEGFPGSRTITVPNADFNLLTELSGASDGFDVYVAPDALLREAI